MPKSITSVDDGFDKPVNRDENRDIKSETGNPQSEGTAKRIAGFDSVSPFDIIDGGTDTSASTGNSQPRRRGRPPGSRNRTAAATETVQKNLIQDFESLLLSVHFMGAKILSIPEMELDEEESKKLSNAIKNVAKYYAVNFDPKKLAWAELFAAAGGIYVPRFIAASKRQPKQPGPQLVPKPEPSKQPQVTPMPKVQIPSQMWNQTAEESGGDSPMVSGLDYSSVKV